MARTASLLARLRRGPAQATDGAAFVPPLAPRRAAPPRGVLRRERRALARAREERIRDLGGLILEMYRQDRFRDDLVAEQCAELLELEGRIRELDALLAARGGGALAAARCTCGAPLMPGAHFCAHCGRATTDAPVVICASCGHPLPADVKYCGMCGSAALPVEVQSGPATARGGEAENAANGSPPAVPVPGERRPEGATAADED